MSVFDDEAKACDELVLQIERVEGCPRGLRGHEGVGICYAPRRRERLDGESLDGPIDPWYAEAAGVRGTGQDAEMAVLDLRSRLEADLTEALARAQDSADKFQARLAAASAFLKRRDERRKKGTPR